MIYFLMSFCKGWSAFASGAQQFASVASEKVLINRFFSSQQKSLYHKELANKKTSSEIRKDIIKLFLSVYFVTICSKLLL